MQLVLFSILNFSLDQHFIIATRFEWEYFYCFDIPLNVHKVDDSLHVTGLYTIPVINQNNITFIAFADTSVTVLIHWLQLGAFTYCDFCI